MKIILSQELPLIKQAGLKEFYLEEKRGAWFIHTQNFEQMVKLSERDIILQNDINPENKSSVKPPIDKAKALAEQKAAEKRETEEKKAYDAKSVADKKAAEEKTAADQKATDDARVNSNKPAEKL